MLDMTSLHQHHQCTTMIGIVLELCFSVVIALLSQAVVVGGSRLSVEPC